MAKGSRPTSTEDRLPLAQITKDIRIRVSKRVNGVWENFYIQQGDELLWILSQIIIPPAASQLKSNWTEANPASVQFILNKPTLSPVEMTTAQRTLYSGDPIIAIDTNMSDAATCATFIFRGGSADINKWTPL